METGKQYQVNAAGGLPFGYFLDDRLYEYRTSTCIGYLNDEGQLVDEHEILGHRNGEQLLMCDGELLIIEL